MRSSSRSPVGAGRRAFYDDFEEMQFHSTILLDAEGRVRWKQTGGDPFLDTGCLLKEIARLESKAAPKEPAVAKGWSTLRWLTSSS